MAEGEREQVRTVRLPVSGYVVQWLPDGRWRMVSRAQFDTEKSRSPRLPVVWNEPDDSDGISSEANLAPDQGVPAWWRFDGMVTDERVEARYPDGSEAPVIIAGPIWIIEGLVSLGKPYVAVGEPISEAIRREQARAAIFAQGDPGTKRGSSSGGWWGAPPQSQRPEPDTSGETSGQGGNAGNDDPVLRQGVAWVVWTYEEPGAYSCSLQPFAGQRLPMEDGPDLPSLDEALRWARARTSRIIVRPEWDPGQNYAAIDGRPENWKRLR
jgi:hypothetical protein